MESKPRNNAPAGHEYEVFEPSMEWAQEPGADTLRVYLPGFKREQLKVQVTSSRVLRISGERPLNENKWSSFRKEIPISLNYDLNEITARYDKGILSVKHPKLIVPDAAEPREQELPPVEASKPDQKPPQEKVQPSSESAPKPEKQPQETLEPVVGMEKGRGSKIEGVANANDNASPKTPRKEEQSPRYEWKERSSDNGKAEAKGIATTSESAEPENLDDSTLYCTKMDKDKAATGLLSGTEKLRMVNYKKAFEGFATDMKKPRKLRLHYQRFSNFMDWKDCEGQMVQYMEQGGTLRNFPLSGPEKTHEVTNSLHIQSIYTPGPLQFPEPKEPLQANPKKLQREKE
ncbi:unnamed protein product [Dovyalis caffra]|uniref:SHSP domain-containing protein n=1 Tax=Dovyalis caffra TaxID=77055 RepID=A0AAV1R736_9ROSI|nr:unnamed protein product [Dovyalis caffra]